MKHRRPIALVLLAAGAALALAGGLRGDRGRIADVMTYGNFDAPPSEGQSGIAYLAPGGPDLAREKVYRFDGDVDLHPLIAMAVLFALMLAWAVVRNPEIRHSRRWLVQWLGFVGTRLGVLRVAGLVPVPRCALGAVPLLNCHTCEMANAACPIGALQAGLRFGELPMLAIGVVSACGALAGGWFCGWLCPFGFIEDLLGRFSRRRLGLPRALGWGRFVMLALVVVVPLGLGLAGITRVLPFCATVCPSGVILGLGPYYLTTGQPGLAEVFSHPIANLGAALLLSGHLAVLAIYLVAVLLVRGRVFCRTLCPLGAALGSFNSVSLVRVDGDGDVCRECEQCQGRCPMGDAYRGDDFLARTGCIRCGRCVRTCPHHNRRWLVGAAAPRDNGADATT